MGPLSNDLRERNVAAFHLHEEPRRVIARRFRVNESFITRLLKLRREQPQPNGTSMR